MNQESQDLAVNKLTEESHPLRSKKFMFASGTMVLLVAMFMVNRFTGGSAEVERDLILSIGALITFFLGGQSLVDSRRATVLGKVATAPRPSQAPPPG